LSAATNFGHSADGFLDRHVHVAAVPVVEVDQVGLQPLQALVDALAHVGGVAADADPACSAVRGIDLDAEFGCERYLVAAVGEQLAVNRSFSPPP
jgi:hypothetical protein